VFNLIAVTLLLSPTPDELRWAESFLLRPCDEGVPQGYRMRTREKLAVFRLLVLNGLLTAGEAAGYFPDDTRGANAGHWSGVRSARWCWANALLAPPLSDVSIMPAHKIARAHLDEAFAAIRKAKLRLKGDPDTLRQVLRDLAHIRDVWNDICVATDEGAQVGYRRYYLHSLMMRVGSVAYYNRDFPTAAGWDFPPASRHPIPLSFFHRATASALLRNTWPLVFQASFPPVW
jgi:hypothetical protein